MNTHPARPAHTAQKDTYPMSPRRRRTSPLTIKYFLQALQDRPGEWLKLPTEQSDYSTVVSHINAGNRPNIPPHLYEAKALSDGAYVRYTGATTNNPTLLPTDSDLGADVRALRHDNDQLRQQNQELLQAMNNLTEAVNRLAAHFES